MSGKYFLYPYQEGEIVELKKQHPCGSKQWRVIRVGAEIKIECLGCQHILNLSRSKIEKITKNVKLEITEDRAHGGQ